jgi:SulP family sulfate permease
MAIAIGSGAKPEQGLYASIIAGFIISAFGGSRFQIGGPAGAFIVLVATTIERFGYPGFLTATIMAGILLLLLGYARLGSYIKFIPHPVAVGFTAGIAIIIGAGEIKDFFGLPMAHEPVALVAKIPELIEALPMINWRTTTLGIISLIAILMMRRLAPHLPSLLIVVFLAGLVTWVFDLPIETIGTKFGGIPSGLPAPSLPTGITFHRLIDLLPSAIAIAVLGGFESLLSAVVADGMSGRRHRSNCELVAQGWANITSALFGGLCATGAIARTNQHPRSRARAGFGHPARPFRAGVRSHRRAAGVPRPAGGAGRRASHRRLEHDRVRSDIRHSAHQPQRKRCADVHAAAHLFQGFDRSTRCGHCSGRDPVHAPHGAIRRSLDRNQTARRRNSGR